MRATLLAATVTLMAVLPSARAAIVTDVQVNEQTDRVEVYATTIGQAKTWCGQSQNGKWIVLDIAAGYGAQKVHQNVSGDVLKSVSAGWYGHKPAKTRVSIITSGKTPYELTKINDSTIKWTVYKKATPIPVIAKAIVQPKRSKERLPSLPGLTAMGSRQSSQPSMPVHLAPAPVKLAAVSVKVASAPKAVAHKTVVSQADSKGTKVTGISVFDKPDRVEIRAKTDGRVASWANRAMNGRAVTLGILADYKTRSVWQGVLNPNVVHVEAGLYQSRPATSRVIVSVMNKVPYDLDTTNNREIVFTVWKSNAARQAALASKKSEIKVAGLVEELPAPGEEPVSNPVEPVIEPVSTVSSISESIVAAPSEPTMPKMEQPTASREEPAASPDETLALSEPKINFQEPVAPKATIDLALATPAKPIPELTAEEPSSSPVDVIALTQPVTHFNDGESFMEPSAQVELALAKPGAPKPAVAIAPKPIRPVRTVLASVPKMVSAKSSKLRLSDRKSPALPKKWTPRN